MTLPFFFTHSLGVCVPFSSFFNKAFSFYLNSSGRTGPNGRDRHSPPFPSRSGYKGWPVCRCHHRHLLSLSVQWPIGQIRCCNDRRDYIERSGAAGESPRSSKMNHLDLAADFQHPCRSPPPPNPKSIPYPTSNSNFISNPYSSQFLIFLHCSVFFCFFAAAIMLISQLWYQNWSSSS